MKSESNIIEIAKEKIKFLHFPKEDVLLLVEDKKQRSKSLNRAISLGNLDHQKVKIMFEDVEGLKQVDTTIWGITDKDVILKENTIIPISRIVKINLL